MNRLLLIVVVLLVPIAIVSSKDESNMVIKAETLEHISLEVPYTNEIEEVKEPQQVLISNNRDKSEPFYIDLEDYIIGVVAGEMPASFNREALKAQAVAARSFAMYKVKNFKNYVLSTTINDQVYLTIDKMKKKWGNDFQFYYDIISSVVNETKGEVVTYNGEVASTYYFAISNGYTDTSEVVFRENKDYLVSANSPWDKNYKSFTSERSISKNNFCSKLNISCGEINISNIVRSDTNYVREITINNKKFTGLEIFNKLGLKSTDFEINISGDNVLIKTYGFGHGVGMSQYGAQGMAQEGYSYKEILKHYYKNTDIGFI